jgi:Transglycosylase SLT domain/D-alanyl-D-alanine carboxypeptidase
MPESVGAGPPLVAVTALPGAAGGLAVAAALGVAAARKLEPDAVILCEPAVSPRRPTLVASGAARGLETRLRGSVRASARGSLCWVTLAPDGWRGELEQCLDASPGAVIAFLRPPAWRELLATRPPELRGAVVRADLPAGKPLAALVAIELRRMGVVAGVVTRGPGLVPARRAIAGIDPGGSLSGRASRLARRLLPGVAGESGQALPLVLGLALVTIAAALALALIGVAATAGGRVQRAADLAAVSAARSLRDDHARLFVPARTPGGRVNPLHLGEREYRHRARAAAAEALRANGVPATGADVSFPAGGPAPTRVRVLVRTTVGVPGEGVGAEAPAKAAAVAEAFPPTGPATAESPPTASGGGYSGPLAVRQGEPMRPDVAAAFDRLAAAAQRAGHALLVNSAYRSDEEQAALFAANPDPRWVAPPGTSLHRCATELDLGPSSAYGWLAAEARRFGFLRRYSWEPWHFGYVRGPAPCSAAGNGVGRGADGAGAGVSLPAFVPARFRGPIARAASRWNVLPGLLAAQIMAESGFNPFAVSPAGARGIAQFMPGTAAAYGLDDPFRPAAAIDAQAHLMRDLLDQFGEIPLALAAYNAGPAPVAACGCVPPYPETQAYVTRILGLLGGAGAITPPALEVRLVR